MSQALRQIRPKCRSASSIASRFSGGHGSIAREQQNQDEAARRPATPPAASQCVAEIALEPLVEDDPRHERDRQKRRNPRMQRQCPGKDEEGRGTAPTLYTVHVLSLAAVLAIRI
jgi:hypothetical protein